MKKPIQQKHLHFAVALFSLTAACSSGNFTGDVEKKGPREYSSRSDEDAIGTNDQDRIVPGSKTVPSADPTITPKPKPEPPIETPPPVSEPPVANVPPVTNVPVPPVAGEPKPDTKETFSECGLFANTNIFADLYLTSEPRFYEVGQKPLAAQAYGSPVRTFCMSNLAVPLRNFAEGFPGFPDLKAWFILDIHFKLDTPGAGTYGLLMDSDDGSIVTVNGQQIINLDGLRDGNLKIFERRDIALNEKDNIVRIQYMQGPGPDLAIQLKWIPPGTTEAVYIPHAFIKKAR